MDYTSRLDFLIESHRQLDIRIAEIEKSRCWDDIELHSLKKQKLKLKDQIESMRKTNEA